MNGARYAHLGTAAMCRVHSSAGAQLQSNSKTWKTSQVYSITSSEPSLLLVGPRAHLHPVDEALRHKARAASSDVVLDDAAPVFLRPPQRDLSFVHKHELRATGVYVRRDKRARVELKARLHSREVSSGGAGKVQCARSVHMHSCQLRAEQAT